LNQALTEEDQKSSLSDTDVCDKTPSEAIKGNRIVDEDAVHPRP
jgi:hypothetical protein